MMNAINRHTNENKRLFRDKAHRNFVFFIRMFFFTLLMFDFNFKIWKFFANECMFLTHFLNGF